MEVKVTFNVPKCVVVLKSVASSESKYVNFSFSVSVFKVFTKSRSNSVRSRGVYVILRYR